MVFKVNNSLCINQCRQTFLGKHLVRNFPQFVGSKCLDAAEGVLRVIHLAIVKEGLRHAEGGILRIVTCHPYLANDLLLGCCQLGRTERLVAKAFQFLLHQADAAVHIVVLCTEVDAEDACVGVRSQVGLHVIDQSAPFAQGDIQSAVHTRSSQNVVQEVESCALLVVRIVSPTAHHYMSLMRIPMQGQVFRHIVERELAGNCEVAGAQIRSRSFHKPYHFLEVHIALHEENGILRTVEAGGEAKSILALELTEQVGLAQNVPTQRMVGKEQFLEVIEYQLRRTVLVALYLIDDDFYFLVNLRLWEGAMEDNVRQ